MVLTWYFNSILLLLLSKLIAHNKPQYKTKTMYAFTYYWKTQEQKLDNHGKPESTVTDNVNRNQIQIFSLLNHFLIHANFSHTLLHSLFLCFSSAYKFTAHVFRGNFKSLTHLEGLQTTYPWKKNKLTNYSCYYY